MGALQLSEQTNISPKPLKQKTGSEYLIREDILRLVSQNKCKEASELLKQYSEKEFVFVHFKNDIKVYINHAIDLVSAVDMGRNYPNMQSLSWSKQQEIKEKSKKHCDELSQVLEKIEKIYLRYRQADLKTTTYFVKSLWVSAVLVFGTLFLTDLFKNKLLAKGYLALEVALDKISALLSALI